MPDGVTAMPLAQAVAEHPELVEPHLGSVVSGDGDPFAARNDADWTSGLFVHVGPGVRRRRARARARGPGRRRARHLTGAR